MTTEYEDASKDILTQLLQAYDQPQLGGWLMYLTTAAEVYEPGSEYRTAIDRMADETRNEIRRRAAVHLASRPMVDELRAAQASLGFRSFFRGL